MTAAAASPLRQGLLAPVVAVRRTAADPVLVRVQLAWAAVMTGSWAATVALSVAVYSAGGNRAVALAVLARSVPGAVAGPAVGGLVDRLPRRRTMAWAATGSAVAAGLAAAAAGMVVGAVVAVAGLALTTMVFRAAQSAVMPELVASPEDLTAANVLSSAIEALGVFVGPALAALLLAVSGPRLAFLAAALLALLAAVLLAGEPGARPAVLGNGADGAGGWGELVRLAPARLVLLLLLAQTVLSGGMSVLLTGLSVQDLGGGTSGVGLLTSAFGLGGVLGSLGLFALAGSRRLGAWTALGLALWSVPLLAGPLLPSLPPALLLLWLVGVGNVLVDVTTVTLLQRAVPEHLLGRAFGALETVVTAGLGLGAVLAPALAARARPALALAALALLLVVAAALAVPALQRLDALLVAPVRQVALLRGLAPFALLPTPALERLALRLHRQEAADGEDVVRQGEPGRTWYVVEQGELVVAVDGREVATSGAGSAFGEVALLREGVRTATVTARGPAVLWSLAGEEFLAALSGDGHALAAAAAVATAHLERAAPATVPVPEPRGEAVGWTVPS